MQTSDAIGAAAAQLGPQVIALVIPFSNVEIIVGVPPYVIHNSPTVNDGFGDLRFLAKYRLLGA